MSVSDTESQKSHVELELKKVWPVKRGPTKIKVGACVCGVVCVGVVLWCGVVSLARSLSASWLRSRASSPPCSLSLARMLARSLARAPARSYPRPYCTHATLSPFGANSGFYHIGDSPAPSGQIISDGIFPSEIEGPEKVVVAAAAAAVCLFHHFFFFFLKSP